MKPNNMMKKIRGRTNGGRPHHKPSSDSGYEGHSDHRNSDHNRGRPNNNPKGNIHQIYEKYTNLAREALTTGDRVVAEGYYQHAEHYLRLINERNAQERSFNDRQQQQRAVATATPPAPEKTESPVPAEEPAAVIDAPSEASSEAPVETAAVPPVKKNRNKIQLRRKVEPKPIAEDVPAV